MIMQSRKVKGLCSRYPRSVTFSIPSISKKLFDSLQWIYSGLAKELGLKTELAFKKIEMTDEDCVVIANTLWERAPDIVCDPDTRLAFHAAFVMSALGGFRPGCLMRLLYRHVGIALVRDPED